MERPPSFADLTPASLGVYAPSIMKTQTLILIVLGILVFGGVGTYLFLSRSGGSIVPMSPDRQTGGIVGTINDALNSSVSMKCEYTDEEGRKTTAYIKNGMVRTEILASNPEESGNVIVRDNVMYTWNDKSAFKMELPDGKDLETMKESIPQEYQASRASLQDVVSSLERYKDFCKPATVADALFTLPANVTFQDVSSMMGGFEQEVPEGALQYSQEDLERMMEEYGE